MGQFSEMIQGFVPRNCRNPTGKSSRLLKAIQMQVGADEDLLGDIFGHFPIPHNRHGTTNDEISVTREQDLKRLSSSCQG